MVPCDFDGSPVSIAIVVESRKKDVYRPPRLRLGSTYARALMCVENELLAYDVSTNSLGVTRSTRHARWGERWREVDGLAAPVLPYD